MKLGKYKELIVLAKEKVQEALAPLRAKEMHMKAHLEVAKLESEIADREQKIQEQSAKYPVEFEKLLDALDDLELLKRRRDQFSALINEMFGE